MLGHALEVATFDPSKIEIEDVAGEPRVRDLVLAVALGYKNPRNIRGLIKKYRDWLKIGGHAASATGGNESFAGWNFRP